LSLFGWLEIKVVVGGGSPSCLFSSASAVTSPPTSCTAFPRRPCWCAVASAAGFASLVYRPCRSSGPRPGTGFGSARGRRHRVPAPVGGCSRPTRPSIGPAGGARGRCRLRASQAAGRGGRQRTSRAVGRRPVGARAVLLAALRVGGVSPDLRFMRSPISWPAGLPSVTDRASTRRRRRILWRGRRWYCADRTSLPSRAWAG